MDTSSVNNFVTIMYLNVTKIVKYEVAGSLLSKIISVHNYFTYDYTITRLAAKLLEIGKEIFLPCRNYFCMNLY